MRDAIGNQLREGVLVWMQQWSCVARVTRIADGGLSMVTPRGGEVTPPVLTVSIDIPLDGSKVPHGQELMLQGIICILNPQAEAYVDKLMKQ
jgi:hypothetical protein